MSSYHNLYKLPDHHIVTTNKMYIVNYQLSTSHHHAIALSITAPYDASCELTDQ